MKKASWFILFLVMGVSCLDQPDCFRQNLNLVGISFRKMLGGQADTVYVLPVTSPGTQKDTYFLSDTVLAASLSLPVDYLNKENITTFSIVTVAVDGTQTPHTLQVNYSSKTQFVSEDCGERFLVSGLNIIKTDFDSVQLVSGDLSNPSHTNIVVYRCPIPNYMKISFLQYYMDISLAHPDPKIINSISTGPKTILYGETAVNFVRIPVDEGSTTTTFTFNFQDGTTETLTVPYAIKKKTIFDVCGEQQFYKLDTANIRTSFRKDLQIFKIRRDTLFDPPLTNVEIIRCPQNNLVNMVFKRILTEGGSAFRDSVTLANVTADYATGNLLAGITGKVTNITLPLDPSRTFTRFYFELDSASIIKKDTLQLSYTFDNPITYHGECGSMTPIINLQIDNTTFSSQTKIDDPSVKFPAISNLEIIH